MSQPIEEMEIEKAIELVNDEKQRKILTQFKDGCKKDDNITVTEFENYYEIIVSHHTITHSPDERYTGGAEQYFLDKKTGKTKMGWHEHPMRLPDPVGSDIEIEETETEGSPDTEEP